MSRHSTSKLLPYLASRGWLKRVRQGLYTTVPLEAENPRAWVEDDWILLARIFRPAYIGGWTALHHWGLTDQVFRSVSVYTAKAARHRSGTVDATPFVLRVVPKRRLFGLRRVWRAEAAVEASDPSRTLVDVLDAPAMGGGMEHVADALVEYFESEHKDEARLLDYIEHFGNRAVYRRLGWLAERLNLGSPVFVEACRARMGRGRAKLDPGRPDRGPVHPAWHIVENVEGLRRR